MSWFVVGRRFTVSNLGELMRLNNVRETAQGTKKQPRWISNHVNQAPDSQAGPAHAWVGPESKYSTAVAGLESIYPTQKKNARHLRIATSCKRLNTMRQSFLYSSFVVYITTFIRYSHYYTDDQWNAFVASKLFGMIQSLLTTISQCSAKSFNVAKYRCVVEQSWITAVDINRLTILDE